MKVLVTGAGGFIGSHLAERLLDDGHDVTALVRYRSDGSWGHLEKHRTTERRLTVVAGDIADRRCMQGAMDGANVVFHLAALIGIPYSYVAPESYVTTNVLGTLNVLEIARALKTSRVVVTSTSEVYGSARYVPIDEVHPKQPQSPYSATKIAADALTMSYVCSFDLPAVVLRPFNTYGPRQSTRAVLPTVLSQLLTGAPELRLGSLTPRRDLTFVSDTVDGLVRAGMTSGIEGEDIHLGVGSAVSIGELVTVCQQVVGTNVLVVTDQNRVRPPASEVTELLSDNRKAERLLGWVPRVSLIDGVGLTARWIADHLPVSREYAQ